MYVREFVKGGTVLFLPVPATGEESRDRAGERDAVLSQFFKNYEFARVHVFPYCVATETFSSWLFVWVHEDMRVRSAVFDAWRTHAALRGYWKWFASRDLMAHGFVTIAGDLSLRSSPAHGLHEVAYVHKYADDSYTLRIRSHVKMPELPHDFVKRMFLSGSVTGSPAALLKSLW